MRHEPKVSRVLKVGGSQVELRMDDSLIPSVLRVLVGSTSLDAEVDALGIPARPRWLHTLVRLLRWYQGALSPRIGQRCVLDPTCSRYAELALRRHGFLKGCALTLGRLHRCRPGNGGVDVP